MKRFGACMAAAVTILALAGQARADLVGHWTFDGATGLEDSSANPAADGTLVGTAVLVSNVGPSNVAGNKVLSVTKTNGGDSRFNVVDPGEGSKFDLTTAGTIALWVNLDPAFENPSNQDGVPLVNNAEGLVVKEGGSYYLGNNGQQYKMRLAEWGTNNHTGTADNLAGNVYGTWYHAAWTWDGTTSRIYVDGVDLYDQVYSGPLTANDNPIAIGGRVQGDYSTTGLFDDVRIYNTALSQSEIQALMNPSQPPAAHPGDANGDGTIDLQDFGLLKDNFGATAGALWAQGDFNADGAIDLQDFGILKDHFGHTNGDSPVTAVPEPATLSLLALGGLAVLRKRHAA